MTERSPWYSCVLHIWVIWVVWDTYIIGGPTPIYFIWEIMIKIPNETINHKRVILWLPNYQLSVVITFDNLL